MASKQKIVEALVERDYDEVAGLALGDQRVFGKLLGMALDKNDIMAWRAIEAMGVCARAVSRMDPGRVRNVVQRLIWSAREESGGMGWSAPELLAEIVSASPKQFADIPPIIVSLHSEDEEKVFLKGVLWAIARMASSGIRDVPGAREIVASSLDDPDPHVRGLAVKAAAADQIAEAADQIRRLADDESLFMVYQDGQLIEKSVGEMARSALASRG